MTQKLLRHLVEKWKTRLGLDDWEIAVELGEQPKHVGSADWVATRTYAKIWIDPDQKGDSYEDTIIHELLHILLQGHIPAEKVKEDVMFERALDKVVTALRPRRGKKG